MKRICSWCNKEIHSGTEVLNGPDHIVTHGICETCAAGVLAELEEGDLLKANPLPRHYDYAGTDPRLAAFTPARMTKLPR